MNKCIICLYEIMNFQIQLCCKQYYHIDCVWTYLSKTDKCAICKQLISEEIYTYLQKIGEYADKIASISNKKKYVYSCDNCPPILPCQCAYRTYD